jgi:hypothetical protein
LIKEYIKIQFLEIFTKIMQEATNAAEDNKEPFLAA